MAVYDPVKADISIPSQEEKILEFWKKSKIFEKSLEQTRGKKFYSFYDGPPFATGLPHYGHLVPGILKDIVPRYWTMRGFHVPRRFGWDCHGLPVEFEINKSHKIESSKDVLAMGVAKYNALCKSIVTRYTAEWRRTVERIGRWVDMENAYFTMDKSFMQSVWWVFKQLWDKGLVYEGYKVVPYSVGISTPLSNFEANLNYKDVQDPSITIQLKIEGKPNEFFLAWTTTPWTLPSNLALAVGLDIDYVQVKVGGQIYYLAEALLGSYFKKGKDGQATFEVLNQFKGKDFLGWKYEPIFPYFKDKSKQGAFKVISSAHVTTESGTGIVHMAPAFGEEDYQACKANGIPIVNPVDDDGMFTAEVPDFQGRRVKDADKDIIAKLKQNGILYKQDTITHSYPYCWRSDTPLIYRAVSTWFVNVEKFKDRLIQNNSKTAWVPDAIRSGRFGNWLENARDWAISRNRFWGCPIPVWKNAEGEMICIGSADELEKLSGAKVNDLHMEFVDPVTIPSPTGKSPLKRINPVLDCWFESGSMPYAQQGYPLTNKGIFEESFPADFIAEGLDQTRGWFYTLMVIGTALFDKPPFKNLIVNGLVLAEDGKKMSKSLKNYPDPMVILDEHGADALRLYLINSPVVRAQELRFSEKGVKEVVRKILLRWWNAYSFYVSYANIDQFAPKDGFAQRLKESPNILDRWILSRLHSVIQNTHREMESYCLYNVVPHLLQFIEELTNTYIRFNRRHFWAEGMPDDKRFAFETLHEVLMTFTKVMAPFTPFMAETMYLNLSKGKPSAKESVHLESYPPAEPGLLNASLEEAVARMEQLVLMGRNLRETIKVKAKIPLKSMKVIHREASVLQELKKLETYFVDELNVKQVDYLSNEDDFVEISCKANFPVLGQRLGKKMKPVADAIAKLSVSQIQTLESGKTLSIEGETIGIAEIDIRRKAKTEAPHFSTHRLITIDLDPSVSEEQILSGLAREVMRRVQIARKNAGLKLDDRIELELKSTAEIEKAIALHSTEIGKETLAKSVKLSASPQGSHIEKTDIDEDPLELAITVRK